MVRGIAEPVDDAQRPMFERLGTAREDKKWIRFPDGGHGSGTFPRSQMIAETLDWLDKYLGPVD